MQVGCDTSSVFRTHGARAFGTPTKPPGYFSGFAPYEEVDPGMLISQFCVQFILELSKGPRLIATTRDGLCLTTAFGGADLDEVLEVIVLDVI